MKILPCFLLLFVTSISCKRACGELVKSRWELVKPQKSEVSILFDKYEFASIMLLQATAHMFSFGVLLASRLRGVMRGGNLSNIKLASDKATIRINSLVTEPAQGGFIIRELNYNFKVNHTDWRGIGRRKLKGNIYASRIFIDIKPQEKNWTILIKFKDGKFEEVRDDFRVAIKGMASIKVDWRIDQPDLRIKVLSADITVESDCIPNLTRLRLKESNEIPLIFGTPCPIEGYFIFPDGQTIQFNRFICHTFWVEFACNITYEVPFLILYIFYQS